MLTTSTSLVLGIAFVALGAVNVWLVLEAMSQVRAARTTSRLLALHRIGGYLFIALFCLMAYYMLARLHDGASDASPTVTLHIALAMILSPLLFIKVLIARYYKNQYALLMPIGLTIFVLTFVLIASTAGPYLARTSRVERVSVDPTHAPVAVDLNQASDLMQRRCSKCHTLDRVVGARKDARGWLKTVNRMRLMPSAGISDSEAQAIVSYLVSQNQPHGSAGDAQMQVARALVDQRCGRCHTLDRVYKAVHTPDQWRETVTRMVGYAAGSTGALQSGEDKQIIDFLSETQTPEAVNQRKAQIMTASLAGESLIAPSAPASSTPVRSSQRDFRTISFLSLLGLIVAALIVRRPKARVPPPLITAKKGEATTSLKARAPSSTFLLQLVQIVQQTPDAKTLRFAVSGEQQLRAQPGQFLTFSFLFDGRKHIRCYSICSSPSRSGYVEITPKRVNNGCVSLFLNDRALIGMTVEAAGPSGQFCLDPVKDKKIVLIAAGSGITPMMAMLRHLDDLCMNNESTLLYCVRTEQDIMFRRELDELQTRLKGFSYHVLLSNPQAAWPGATGHINRDFICKAVPELEDRMFFLCGPPPFMDAARATLTELRVASQQIRQESFGGAGALSKPISDVSTESSHSVELVRSGKTIAVLEGETLLQAAMRNGVAIPSACRQGQCGTCKTRLLSGNVRMTAEQGLDSESRARGFILTCVGHAAGEVKLDA
jgi:glycine betaine catabolism B